MSQQNNTGTVSISHQQSCDRLQDSIDAAEALFLLTEKPRKLDESLHGTADEPVTISREHLEAAESLLLLSKQPPKVDEDVIVAAMGLAALSKQQPEDDTIQMPSFEVYRQKVLDDMRAALGGQIIKSNPNMRRIFHGSNTLDAKSTAELEKYKASRNKNNESAKKSRDRQRINQFENKIKFDYYQKYNERYEAQLANTRYKINVLKLEVKLARENLMSYDDNFNEVVVGHMD